MSTSAPRCSPRVTIVACWACGLSSKLSCSTGSVGAAGVPDLERVEAADHDADVGAVFDFGDRRVAEDRALGDQLAALGPHVGDLHHDARAEPRGQAGADLEAEQAAAEQRVGVAAVGDRLGHRVDQRLGEALGALGDEHLLGAVVAERCRQVLRDVLAEQDRVRLAAELGGELGALGDGTQGVLVDRAVVVQRVDQDVCHVVLNLLR